MRRLFLTICLVLIGCGTPEVPPTAPPQATATVQPAAAPTATPATTTRPPASTSAPATPLPATHTPAPAGRPATPPQATLGTEAIQAEIERYLRARGSPLAGQFRLERVLWHEDYARADLVPLNAATDLAAGAYLRREAGAWQVLVVGTVFLPEDLEALGVPRPLWPVLSPPAPPDSATPAPVPERGSLPEGNFV